MKYCPQCKKNKELNDFSNNKRNQDGKQRTCKVCMAEHQSKHYNKNKEKYFEREKEYIKTKQNRINILKSECGCKKCGDKRYYVLNFHHINPNEKEFNIGDYLKRVSWETVENEIKKCIVLCSNCHNEFHYLERINNITIEKYLEGVV
jgi:hypothetical protein